MSLSDAHGSLTNIIYPSSSYVELDFESWDLFHLPKSPENEMHLIWHKTLCRVLSFGAPCLLTIEFHLMITAWNLLFIVYCIYNGTICSQSTHRIYSFSFPLLPTSILVPPAGVKQQPTPPHPQPDQIKILLSIHHVGLLQFYYTEIYEKTGHKKYRCKN